MTLRPRLMGRLAALSPADRNSLTERARRDLDVEIESRVTEIGRSVRREGDAALRRLSLELDGARLEAFEVDPELVASAPNRIDRSLRRALDRATRNLERVHGAFLPRETVVESEPGVLVGRRPEPLEAVGVYAPGGRATYPSSVLMGVVPARIAGVRDIIVCSPPGASGLPSDAVLAAAAIGGATRVLALGGAQAIFALAYGTASVPRVDRIVGPGNAYVAEAKRQVAGFVGIDSPAGPSEILIIADESASVELVARELLAQAEHDPSASCVALVLGPARAQAVVDALIASTPERAEIVDAAISGHAAVLSVDSLEDAFAFAAEYAAEHVLLAIREPRLALPRIKNAGTVFFGEGASVAFGDYLTGANHVLPTAGSSRSFSGLSTQDFMRFTTFQEVSRGAAAAMADDVVIMAEAEGLPAHAAAARAFRGSEPASLPREQPRVIARRSVASLTAYVSNRKPAAIDLSDNTNQRGAPPSARAAMAAAPAAALARYPSHYADGLKEAIAKRFDVSPDEVVTGCGSDDVIDCALRAFAVPGDAIAFPSPTFAMIPYFAEVQGLTAIAVPLLGAATAYDADVDAMLAARPRIVYLCSPNNPTGTLVSRAALDRVLREAPNLVILDEAYVEYGGESALSRARADGRLLVVRTLSKAYGLAGQRVGFAIGARDLVAQIEKVRGPYKVSGIGEHTATLALENDADWVAEGVREVLIARERFIAWLGARGARPVPSHANFVLVPVADAAACSARLRDSGISVRAFPALGGFGDCLRISVGPWELMERTLAAFEEVLTCV